jgi:predicted membrane channel-forming protein YqfA (hemolysin III family)
MSVFTWLVREPRGRRELYFPIGPAIVLLVAVLVFEWPRPLPDGLAGVLILAGVIGGAVLSVGVSFYYWRRDRNDHR